MSIIIHIPKVLISKSFAEQNVIDESIHVEDKADTINYPRKTKTNANDLSRLECKYSSKYSLSGDDLSCYSNIYSQCKKSDGEVENILNLDENEVVLEDKSVLTIKSGSPTKEICVNQEKFGDNLKPERLFKEAVTKNENFLNENGYKIYYLF
jgi:hypothetical protein